MTRWLVDPLLLGLPDDASAEALKAYVDGLQVWSEALGKEHQFLLPADCKDALLTAGLYPDFERLRRLFKAHRPGDNTWGEITRRASMLYDQLRYEVDEVACAALECDEGTVALAPPDFVTRLPEVARDPFTKTLIGLAFWYAYFHEDEDDGITFAAAPCPGAMDAEHIVVSVTVSDYIAQSRPCECPVELDEPIPLAYTHAQPLERKELVEIWGMGDVVADVKRAIDRRVQELVTEGTATASNIRQYQLGDHFLQTVQAVGFTAARGGYVERLLSVIARLLVGKPAPAPRPFRKDANSRDQLTRGDDLAWRLHVTESHEAYRLMYWELPDRRIELAAVRTKKDIAM